MTYNYIICLRTLRNHHIRKMILSRVLLYTYILIYTYSFQICSTHKKNMFFRCFNDGLYLPTILIMKGHDGILWSAVGE